jgi:PAS domain S-box-containing protein
MSIPAKKISATSQAMDTFEQSEQLFRVLIEKSSDAIALLDRNGMVLYASPSTTRVLGYTSEEFVGHSTLQLIHPDDLEQTTHALAAVIEEPGKSLTLEYRVRHKDSAWRWVEGTGINLMADSSVRSVVLTYRDVTERKWREEEQQQRIHAMQEQQRTVDALQNASPDHIFMLDSQGRFTYVNRAAREVIQAASTLAKEHPEDILGNTGRELGFPPAFLRQFEAQIAKACTGKTVAAETSFPTPHGIRMFEYILSPVYSGDGSVEALVGITRDIHERKQAEEALREQEVKLHVNELKDQLLLHLSHEFRTPLTAVRGYLELLESYHERLDTPQQATFLNKALASCNELALLLDTIMEAMQITYEVKPAKPEKLVVAQVLREVVEQLDSQLEREHTLQLDISEQVTVWADKHYLRQIARNLLSNAFKYAPKQTPVIIRAAIRECARGGNGRSSTDLYQCGRCGSWYSSC